MCPCRTRCAFAILLIVITGAAACTAGQTSSDPATASSSVAPQGIFKLDHLIFLVQENRSFDHYFGTYPGANRIPTNADGSFSVCVPDKFEGGQCMEPYVSDAVDQYGGPHPHADAVRDVNGGTMHGFIATMPDRPGRCWVEPTRGKCPMYFGPQHQPDVMSTLP